MKHLTLVLGTKNQHKVREIQAIYKQTNPRKGLIKFIPLSRFPNTPVVRETGRTYLANAAKKAIVWAKYTGLPVLAEDSGIEVKALNWQPGLRSARFASNHRHKNATDAENIQKLLTLLSGLPMSKRTALRRSVAGDLEGRRTARYRCAAVIASPTGRIIARTEGTCWGRIALKPAGQNGFGYDPVFVPRLKPRGSNYELRIMNYELGKTFGELPAAFKHRISHRGIALRKIFRKIAKLQMVSNPNGLP
ncbi:MAG: non-canonical purine NTP pyrophosphatase [Planctomycetota bacterium]